MDLDGIAALPLLLEKKPDLVVIMASTLTRRNAEISLRALSLGAADYIPKPGSNREVSASTAFRRDLIEKIRQLGQRAKRLRSVAPARAPKSAPSIVPQLEEIVAPVLRQFAPQFILVSAGFDCHWRDPLGAMQVTEKGFLGMTRSLLAVAAEVAGGRIAAVLEGGYDLDAIRGSTEAVLAELSHGAREHAPAASRTRAFDRLRDVLAPHWRL